MTIVEAVKENEPNAAEEVGKAEVTETTSPVERKPEIATSPEKEPEVTSLPEREPEVATSPEKEPEMATPSENEPEMASAIKKEGEENWTVDSTCTNEEMIEPMEVKHEEGENEEEEAGRQDIAWRKGERS